MVSKKFRMRADGVAAVCGLLLLSACGGGGGGSAGLSPQPAPDPAPAPEQVALAASYTDLAATAQNGQLQWPDGSGTGASIAGVDCIVSNVSHNHALVSIYRDGVRLALPASVGLKGCTYEMHTHDRSGVVHIEPNVSRELKLGQFFAVWNQPLTRSAVAGLAGPVRYFVIENEVLTRFDGDPADIVLAAHKEIVILTGTGPAVLPRYRWPSSL